MAWNVSWTKFYHPSTNLFYDYISSYEKGEELSHLPSVQEVNRQYPNPCGYGTGMEDCMILTGTMLDALVDRYKITADEKLKEYASAVLRGIAKSSLIENAPGFVARGLCVEDGKSFYINSSRDQYTHCVYGLWKYYKSSMPSDGAKDTIRLILSNIANRMIQNVTPEHNYDFLRMDNKPCPLGICKMWNVQSHEAARLPMFYAAAWDVTGKKAYYELYRKYVYDAVVQSEAIEKNHSAYVFVQMLYSFDLLFSLETDSDLQKRLCSLKERVGKMALERSKESLDKLIKLNREQLAVLGPDWRNVEVWDMQKGYKIPRWGEYRKIWELIREIGESSLVVYMQDNEKLHEEEFKILNEYLSAIDYTRISSCGIIFHVASYWKAKKFGINTESVPL
ncbi:hypothetical protein H8784_06500 [Parabacteroides acidifaciens]|uniref:Uncharacterized protein n=1 Tax=Parabacteroides acidifaciens TaxID=2290935 RepID=A0A3D8HGX3_9BACT|nr:hypothetical protein [Parabacteroides acidifaciens]RDU49940.1 hypothetical protein DWU89_06650 [Parabacteroides acidifaciens]